MGYRELELKLRKRSEKEIKSIEDDFADQVSEVEADIGSDASREAKQIIERGRRKAQLQYMKKVGEATRQSKAMIEAAKSSFSDEIIEAARERVLELPDEDKAKLLTSLAKDEGKIGKDARIIIDPEYVNLLSADNVKAGDIGDFGLVIESADGSIRVDNTLATLIETKKVKLKPIIYDVLFGDADVGD